MILNKSRRVAGSVRLVGLSCAGLERLVLVLFCVARYVYDVR